MDPLALWDAQAPRRLRRTEHQSRCLVHVVVGVHQLRVGEGDRAVDGAGRADFRAGLRIAHPSVGVVRGDAAEAGPQFGNALDVRGKGLAAGVANGVLEDGIHLDGLRDAALGFDAVAHLQLRAEAAIRLARRVAPIQIHPGAPRLGLGAATLGASQHHHAPFAALDLQGGLGEHALHGIPAPGRNARFRARAADGFGHRLGGIPVRPHATDDAHGVHLAEQRRALGVVGGFAHGGDHQIQRFRAGASRRVGVALFDLRDADEHRQRR